MDISDGIMVSPADPTLWRPESPPSAAACLESWRSGACVSGARADGKWTLSRDIQAPHLPLADCQAYGWLCSCPTSTVRARLSACISGLGAGLARGSGGAG